MKSGEIIFPGKKEMVGIIVWMIHLSSNKTIILLLKPIQALKLDVMTKEILKLRKVLDGFQRERCQISLTREIFKSIMCSVSVQIYNIINNIMVVTF